MGRGRKNYDPDFLNKYRDLGNYSDIDKLDINEWYLQLCLRSVLLNEIIKNKVTTHSPYSDSPARAI